MFDVNVRRSTIFFGTYFYGNRTRASSENLYNYVLGQEKTGHPGRTNSLLLHEVFFSSQNDLMKRFETKLN